MDPAPQRTASALNQRTLVLNRGWVPVHVTTVRRALTMMYQRAAAAVRTDTYETFDFSSWIAARRDGADRVVRTVRYCIPAPDVILLLNYDRMPRYNVPFSRKNLCRRDQYSCQYCGRRQSGESLTVDHVVPRARGGNTSWINCVLACASCNRKKGDRTPDEAGMRLLASPAHPDWSFVFRHESTEVSRLVLRRLMQPCSVQSI